MSKTKQHILIVDDELEIRKIIQEILNDEGYSTATASSADEARKQANEKKPDLVFLENFLHLPVFCLRKPSHWECYPNNI